MRKILFILFFPLTIFGIHSSIGSYLNVYFSKLLKHSLLNEELPESYKKALVGKNQNEVLAFYRALPLSIDLTDEEKMLLDNIPVNIWPKRSHWNPSHWKRFVNLHYLDYHKVVASVSQRIIKNALSEIGFERNIEHPVIHYRLSDVPFCRSKGHHLYKYSFYLWALEKLSFSDEGNKTVIIVSSNSHKSNSDKKVAAEKYLKAFIQFLNENGYNTIIQSGTIIEDFATMVFSPALISSSSAFSFHAGLANDRIFLSALMGHEYKGRFFTVDNCEWMCPDLPVLHKDVEDYFDTEAVIKLLKEDNS